MDGHEVVESKSRTISVTPTSTFSFTQTETRETIVDGHESTETFTTIDTFTPSVLARTATE
jgi:hypothetical protein